jgi:hypothetical protein
MQFTYLSRVVPVICLFLLSCLASAQAVPEPLPVHNATQDKNFYLLSIIQNNPDVRSALSEDKILRTLATERQEYLKQAIRFCKGNAVCTMKSFLWTEEEIRIASLALAQIYQDNSSIREMVDKSLRPSGAYVLYQKESGDTMLVNAWEICARGLNNIISVYGQGIAPHYLLIDSISFDVTSADFQQRITSLAKHASMELSDSGLFFDPSLKVSLQLLTINHRDEAGRQEPMERAENAPAVRAIALTHWIKFPYAVIVVPGAGPSTPDVALSDEGRSRTALAAEAYHAGEAPFILVSGGYVHPSQTRFAEALEMKKALLADYHVPESAIIIDPHARHTTTNVRDAAREIFRYKIPMDKPSLVISNVGQISSIASQAFAYRCMKEMGYLPYQIINRISDTSLIVFPQIESLQQYPMDPLDP